MSIVGLLGASGYTGRLVASALDRRGIPFVAAGRDAERLAQATAGLRHVAAVQVLDVDDQAGLAELCAGVAALVTTVGPYEALGGPVLEAAMAAPCHYVDCTGEQPFIRWAFESFGDRGAVRDPTADPDEVAARNARESRVTALTGYGFESVVGDALAHLAAAEVSSPREVHVAYLVRGRSWTTSSGTRATMGRLIGRPGWAYVGTRLVEERFAEVRRHAWFPRPVGPRHAAGFPGGEPLMVPRHVPEVRLVRTYLAVPGTLADAAQLLDGLARWEPARRVVQRALRLGPEGPTQAQREASRWACVAEVSGDGGEVARAWAHGRDVYGLTGEIMADGAVRLLAGQAHAVGVAAPAEAFPPDDVLDALAATSDLRWSVRTASEPGTGAGPGGDA